MKQSLTEIIMQIRINATLVRKLFDNGPLADQMVAWADDLDELARMIDRL